MDEIRIPESFREMPRWWRDGPGWLDRLPGIIATMCARWHLEVTGDPLHGSNALVVPVDRAGGRYVLRLSPPGPEVSEQVTALRFWAGRGTVELVDADPDAGAMLLERLALDGSLHGVPVGEAVVVLGRMMRRLAVPAPAWVRSTATLAADRTATMPVDWARLGRPFEETFLRRAVEIGARLSRPEATTATAAVNGDLHSAQVLRGRREPWLAVDPVLLRGDIAFDLARVLWTRMDEMPGERAIVSHFDAAVRAAGVERDHGRDWVLFRTVDYWLWGLGAGLTEDPLRCRRLVLAFAE